MGYGTGSTGFSAGSTAFVDEGTGLVDRGTGMLDPDAGGGGSSLLWQEDTVAPDVYSAFGLTAFPSLQTANGGASGSYSVTTATGFPTYYAILGDTSTEFYDVLNTVTEVELSGTPDVTSAVADLDIMTLGYAENAGQTILCKFYYNQSTGDYKLGVYTTSEGNSVEVTFADTPAAGDVVGMYVKDGVFYGYAIVNSIAYEVQMATAQTFSGGTLKTVWVQGDANGSYGGALHSHVNDIVYTNFPTGLSDLEGNAITAASSQPVLILADTFTDTNFTQLASHTPDYDATAAGWVARNTNDLRVESNTARAASSFYGTAYTNVDQGATCMRFDTDWHTGLGASGYLDLYLLETNPPGTAGDGVCRIYFNQNSNLLHIYEYVSGGLVERAQVAISWGAGVSEIIATRTANNLVSIYRNKNLLLKGQLVNSVVTADSDFNSFYFGADLYYIDNYNGYNGDGAGYAHLIPSEFHTS